MKLQDLKSKNKLRVFRAGYLTVMFSYYTQRLLKESILGNSTYENLEKTAELINFLTGDNVTAASLWCDDSVTADECIELKRQYDSGTELAPSLGIPLDLLDALMNSFEHDPKFTTFKLNCPMWSYVMSTCIDYMDGRITHEEFISIMQHYQGSSLFMVDFRRIIRAMRMVEDEVIRIAVLQTVRRYQNAIQYVPALENLRQGLLRQKRYGSQPDNNTMFLKR